MILATSVSLIAMASSGAPSDAAQDAAARWVARTIESNEAATSLPCAPNGDYRVLKFHTQFANKRDAVETVMVEQEAGGWKVDGYFIR